jgi:hypothetical protein
VSGKYCVDTNVLITAWHVSYPPRMPIFQPLWKQIAQHQSDIILLKPIFDEIEPIPSGNELTIKEKKERYPLRVWLVENGFVELDISNEVNVASLELESEYEIDNESKGAGQIDITLIAYAKVMEKAVVTLESPQPHKPGKKYNYKIPLICDEQKVDCIDFVAMLDQLNLRRK